MNQKEYAALFEDSHISDRERTLYLYLRMHMDYGTGIVGLKRKISYQAIREHLEYKPERGSKAQASSPTKDQIKRLLQKLERYGWIEPLHTKRIGESMIFRLVLASTGAIRPNEERHMSATEALPRSNPVNTASSDTMSAIGAPQHDRHTSDPSDIKIYQDARAREVRRNGQSLSGQDLNWSNQFLSTARLTGLQLDPDRLQGVFEAFRFHKTNRNTVKPMGDWLADWRAWCGREKAYGKSTTQRSGAGGNQRPENATAKLLRESEEASERLARHGFEFASGTAFDDFER
ncbi:hypothetical protein [Idiomarina xiamenensis]|uniref:Replication protein O of bacteriophage n=1 Tax=Idiomarina xiamenensis 10-D-4 TaxID=740709 RepID=K2J8I7_9GAMM|nr:hypothetical protein [Idiomarina xiamenensis]EKE79456.1 replication protein O of bacteriophage [Idiomarina xiamenensis 10-D-4]